MIKTVILVIGTDETMLLNSTNLINTNPAWNAVSAETAEDAIEKFHQRNFDAVVFTNGTHEEDKKLRKVFTLQNPGAVIIENNDDDTLVNEIAVALEIQHRKNKPSFSFTDDGLKNARLPIIVQ